MSPSDFVFFIVMSPSDSYVRIEQGELIFTLSKKTYIFYWNFNNVGRELLTKKSLVLGQATWFILRFVFWNLNGDRIRVVGIRLRDSALGAKHEMLPGTKIQKCRISVEFLGFYLPPFSISPLFSQHFWPNMGESGFYPPPLSPCFATLPKQEGEG